MLICIIILFYRYNSYIDNYLSIQVSPSVFISVNLVAGPDLCEPHELLKKAPLG